MNKIRLKIFLLTLLLGTVYCSTIMDGVIKELENIVSVKRSKIAQASPNDIYRYNHHGKNNKRTALVTTKSNETFIGNLYKSSNKSIPNGEKTRQLYDDYRLAKLDNVRQNISETVAMTNERIYGEVKNYTSFSKNDTSSKRYDNKFNETTSTVVDEKSLSVNETIDIFNDTTAFVYENAGAQFNISSSNITTTFNGSVSHENYDFSSGDFHSNETSIRFHSSGDDYSGEPTNDTSLGTTDSYFSFLSNEAVDVSSASGSGSDSPLNRTVRKIEQKIRRNVNKLSSDGVFFENRKILKNKRGGLQKRSEFFNSDNPLSSLHGDHFQSNFQSMTSRDDFVTSHEITAAMTQHNSDNPFSQKKKRSAEEKFKNLDNLFDMKKVYANFLGSNGDVGLLKESGRSKKRSARYVNHRPRHDQLKQREYDVITKPHEYDDTNKPRDYSSENDDYEEPNDDEEERDSHSYDDEEKEQYNRKEFHHVKIKVHGNGKSPEEWAKQEQEEARDLNEFYARKFAYQKRQEDAVEVTPPPHTFRQQNYGNRKSSDYYDSYSDRKEREDSPLLYRAAPFHGKEFPYTESEHFIGNRKKWILFEDRKADTSASFLYQNPIDPNINADLSANVNDRTNRRPIVTDNSREILSPIHDRNSRFLADKLSQHFSKHSRLGAKRHHKSRDG